MGTQPYERRDEPAHLLDEASPRRFLSLRPAAAYLAVSPVTLRRHFLHGRIRAYRFGARDLKFDIADLDAYMTEAVPTQADKPATAAPTSGHLPSAATPEQKRLWAVEEAMNSDGLHQ